MNDNLAVLRRLTPRLSIFGALVMVICDVSGILLNPSYSPLRQGISKLALSPSTGWLEKLAFAVLGLAILITAAGLASSELAKQRRLFLALSLLLALNGLGFVVISIFNTDAGAQHTLHGMIHGIAAATSGSVPSLFALIFAIGFIKDERLRPYVLYTVLVGAFAAIGGLVHLRLPELFGLGIYERILMALTLIWLGLAGTGLLKVAETP